MKQITKLRIEKATEEEMKIVRDIKKDKNRKTWQILKKMNDTDSARHTIVDKNKNKLEEKDANIKIVNYWSNLGSDNIRMIINIDSLFEETDWEGRGGGTITDHDYTYAMYPHIQVDGREIQKNETVQALKVLKKGEAPGPSGLKKSENYLLLADDKDFINKMTILLNNATREIPKSWKKPKLLLFQNLKVNTSY